MPGRILTADIPCSVHMYMNCLLEPENRFGKDASPALRYIISGWQLSGTVRVTSGRPFTAFSGLNTVSQTTGSYVNCNSCDRNMGNLVQGNFRQYGEPIAA